MLSFQNYIQDSDKCTNHMQDLKKKKKKHMDPSAPFHLLPDQGSPKTAYTTQFFHNNRPKALLTGKLI